MPYCYICCFWTIFMFFSHFLLFSNIFQLSFNPLSTISFLLVSYLPFCFCKFLLILLLHLLKNTLYLASNMRVVWHGEPNCAPFSDVILSNPWLLCDQEKCVCVCESVFLLDVEVSTTLTCCVSATRDTAPHLTVVTGNCIDSVSEQRTKSHSGSHLLIDCLRCLTEPP